MKLIAVLTVIVVGTSALALGRPGPSAPAPTPSPTAWRDRQEARLDHDRAHRRFRPVWIMLSEPSRIVLGRDVIRIAGDGGRYARLRFQATAGSSQLERVLIRFADGHWQQVDLDARLDRAHPMLVVDLEGNRRELDQIIVLGSSGRRAAYQVFGS